MELLCGWIFRIFSYAAFGLCLEIFFTAIAQLVDGVITAEDRRLRGTVSLYMIPVYGILMFLCFEPMFLLLEWAQVAWYVRIGIYAIGISGMEALCGWIYDKVFHVMPWDYSQCRDKVFARGYTRWSYVPLWGVAGLVLEQYVTFVRELSPYVYQALMIR